MFSLPSDIFNSYKNHDFITLSNLVSVRNTGQIFPNLLFYRPLPKAFVLIFINAIYIKEGGFYCIADETTVISHFGGLVAISRRNVKLLFEACVRYAHASLRNGRGIGGDGGDVHRGLNRRQCHHRDHRWWKWEASF